MPNRAALFSHFRWRFSTHEMWTLKFTSGHNPVGVGLFCPRRVVLFHHAPVRLTFLLRRWKFQVVMWVTGEWLLHVRMAVSSVYCVVYLFHFRTSTFPINVLCLSLSCPFGHVLVFYVWECVLGFYLGFILYRLFPQLSLEPFLRSAVPREHQII